MSLIFSVHVGIDGPEEVTANLEPLANGARVPLLKLGRAAVSFPFDDKEIVDVCDKIVSATLDIRAEALARMVAAA